MSFSLWSNMLRHICSLGCAFVVTVTLAHAQSAPSNEISSNSSWSSSWDGYGVPDGSAPASAALPSAPSPSASASAGSQQDTNTYSGWHGSDLARRFTFEAGGGFNAPMGNDTPYITWGGNFTVGAGVHFSKAFSALVEYQFMDNKLPGAFISSANSANTSGTPVTSGDAHINSITGSPVFDLTPKKSTGLYLVGGWGWYHKSTNFNGYACCVISYFGLYPVEVTEASFSSNQWGANLGLGLYHRLGGMYGERKAQLFMESRYTFIHTPPITATNGLGTTELIPVTLGIRF